MNFWIIVKFKMVAIATNYCKIIDQKDFLQLLYHETSGYLLSTETISRHMFFRIHKSLNKHPKTKLSHRLEITLYPLQWQQYSICHCIITMMTCLRLLNHLGVNWRHMQLSGSAPNRSEHLHFLGSFWGLKCSQTLNQWKEGKK